jgi:RNA polymerase-binding transcription factor DksA
MTGGLRLRLHDLRGRLGQGLGDDAARGSAPGSHHLRFALLPHGSARRVPVIACASDDTPRREDSAGRPPRWRSEVAHMPSELRKPAHGSAICYPSPAMPQTKLTAKETADLKGRLEEERHELREQLSTIEEETFATSQSELSGDVGLDDESADAGTATFEREKDLSIENNVRDLLAKIERALARIDDGSYGTCERCGKPIEKARIKALPYVDLCIKDAQARSRR